MNKPPAFQFYPKDFLSDINVSMMNMEERGIYITLLSYCWLEGWLPIASTKLKHLCSNPPNWKESWENVRHCFFENGNKLCHKRLEEERNKQLKWREKSREGGIKSGESRKTTGETKGGSTKVKPKGNSSSSSSSPSSSSTPTVTPKDIHIQQIIAHWNSKNIKNLEDRESKIKKKTISKITRWLEDYSSDEIIEAIDNYDSILKSEKHFFSYKWQLCDFMDRGLTNFLSKNKPLVNYLVDKRKPKTRQETEDQKKKDWASKED